jgi:sphingomyelin phosphodiesterase acid-like 3
MPPGVDERQNGGISPYHDVFQERFNQRYLKLVRKYSDIIVGQFFGHLHSDSFRIVYSDTGKMSVLPPGFAPPSVSFFFRP